MLDTMIFTFYQIENLSYIRFVTVHVYSDFSYMYIHTFCLKYSSINEPPRGKTNNVVSEQVRQKPACTVTEAG